MKKLGLLTLVVLGLVAGLLACQKNSDFLYLVKPTNADSVFKIKELVNGGKVDMLWITGGMVERQQVFYAGVSEFMTQFVQVPGIQWRMAVLSSDPNSDPFLGMGSMGIFDATIPNPVGNMTQAVTNALNSNDGEYIFNPIEKYLDQYPEFLRDDALLAIVITNDARDASNQTADQLLSFLKVKKGDLSKVIIYGVFGSTDLGCRARVDDDEDWNYRGTAFEQVITATGGKGLSLCTNDFGSNLLEISNHLRKNIATTTKIFLKTRPVVSTLKVLYHGNPLPGGAAGRGGHWTYDSINNVIVFSDIDFAVDDNDSIEVTYEEDIGIRH